MIEAWESPARLHLNSHINAPTCRLPVKKIVGGKHITANLTLPYGRGTLQQFLISFNLADLTFFKKVLYDYLKESPVLKNHFDWKLKQHSSQLDFSEEADVLKISGMPLLSPSFSNGHFELKNREHFIFRYRSSPEAIHSALPEPLVANEEDEVVVIFSKSDGSGIGLYQKCESFIPAKFKGEEVLYQVQGYADCSATRTAAREIFGQPLKIGHCAVETRKDTIVATLDYSDQRVATGTMVYHYEKIAVDTAKNFLEIPHITLKLIPGCENSSAKEVASLVKLEYKDVRVREAYTGAGSLSLIPHINAPFADFPVLEVKRASFVKADVTLSSRIVHDYLKDD